MSDACQDPVVCPEQKARSAQPSQRPRRIAFLWEGERRDASLVSGMPLAMALALQSAGVEVIDVFVPSSGGRGGRGGRREAWRRQLRRSLPESVVRCAASARRGARGWIETQWGAASERAMMRSATDRSKQMSLLVRDLEVDLVFGCCVSTSLCRFCTDLPIVYFSDATARIINTTYRRYRCRSKAYRSVCDQIEQAALSNVTISVFASQWAQASAVRDYQAPMDRTAVVPMGAHITQADLDDPRHERKAPTRANLRLCVIAADPVRKRTDFAVRVVEQLNTQGWRAQLELVGPATRRAQASSSCNVLGALKLSSQRDRARLASALSRSHLLLLPSEAEAFGIAVCEAAHFGVPAIVSDAGGLPEVVQDGLTGLMLPDPPDVSAYANAIIQLVSDADRFDRMCEAAQQRAASQLNWDRWAYEMVSIFERAIEIKQNASAAQLTSANNGATVVVLPQKRPGQGSNLRPAV